MSANKKTKTKPIRTEFSYLLVFLSFPFGPIHMLVGDGVQDHGCVTGEEE
jgi:hypothetical protein